MTIIKNILKMSLRNIVNNKLRSALTMLGLVLGIASVLVVVGLGNGTSKSVTSQVSSLGTNVLTLSITNTDYSLDYENLDDLRSISNVDSVSPYKNVSARVSRETTSSSRANILAVTPDYMDILSLTISEGRLLSEIDIENYSKICLIGDDIRETLFSLVDPVGQTLKINGEDYTVVGVLTAVGSSFGTNIDDVIIIPFTTAKYLKSDTSINSLYIKVSDEKKIEDTTELIEYYIENYIGIDSDYFSVSSQDSMLSTMDNITNTFSLLLGGIASISLIVGGIGVMNVMLVSVTERTKEIGIRKALGAKRKDILLQFLIESLVLCLIGGFIGVVFGLGLSNLLEKMGYTFSPTIMIVIISFLSSALIGIVFGVFPANKASKLNPIEALRNE